MPKQNFRTKIIAIAAFSLLFVRIGMGSFFASASDITANSVLQGVNNERAARNIPTLRTDPRLSAAAEYKAQDIITRHYFSHTDPEGNYIWNKIIAEGYYPYSILGENLAINFSDTEGLMAAWMDSPTHRENILNPAYKDQGMGVSLGDVAQGQYSIAIANTFGAQPAVKGAQVAGSTTPTASAPKTQPKTAPAPSQTAQQSAPVQKQTQTAPAAQPEPANLSTPAQQQAPAPIPSATSEPDLFYAFRYIVIFFGAFFALFLISEHSFFRKKKIVLSSDSGALIILLVVSALALVSWWH